MKVIGIIPARYNSSRFPGKPLALINGRSMISLVYEQVKKVKSFSKIIVATDDKRIYDHVKEFGEVMMTSADHQSGTDRCGEIINSLQDDFDVVVNIQGDEPFIQPEQLELLLTAFNDPSTDIATLAKHVSNDKEINNPNVVKIAFTKNNLALYFSRSIIPFPKNNSGNHFKHIGIYSYRAEILKEIVQLTPSQLEVTESLEQLRWLENGFRIKIVETEIDTVGIDTPEDLNK